LSWFKNVKAPWSRRATPTVFTPDGQAPLPSAPASNVRPKKKEESLFPSFHATAGDQLDSKSRTGMAGVRMRLRNAFTPSQPVTDQSRFAGRTEMLTALIRATEDGRLHTVLYGERGIGKTSILHVFAQAARSARYLVSYVSCGASSDFDEMFRAVADDIPLLFHSAYGPTSPEAEKGATFASLLPEGEISVRQASDLCAKVTGTRVLIILDEFDRVESRAFRRSVAEFLKNLSDRSVRVQLIIAGVAANLTELVEHVPSIQRNVFALEAPPLTEAEIRELVQTGESSSGVRFEEPAILHIVSVANGLPYLATLVSHLAGLQAVDDGRTVVTADDVSAGISTALAELMGRISKRSQTQIAACIKDGAHRLLGPLAGAAQLSGGVFDTAMIKSLWRDADQAAKARALADKLAAQNMLLQVHEDEVGRRYRFLEASVPPYLWLYAARENFPDLENLPRPDLARQTAAALTI
jgi:Cdc6-like AAA superfamily ATPase